MKNIILIILFLFLSGNVIAHEGADASHAEEDAYWAELAQSYPAFSPKKLRTLLKVEDAKNLGKWGDVIEWPQVPVSASNLPDGRIITWSASQTTSFPRGTEFTHASTWNPKTDTFLKTDNTYQDMFAAHLSMLEDGRLFVSGGNNHVKTTSIFDYRTNTWSRLQDMNRGRWYPTNVALPSGEVFSALGSSGGRYPEVWHEETGWKVLTGINLDDPILQYENFYEKEWWPLLHVAPQGTLFHSGPTPQMHTLDTKNLGEIKQVGTENRRWYPKHGTTVMYDEGKLLVAGGAVSGTNKESSNKAMLIDINGATPQVELLASMQHSRKFHNGVMLPTGEVLVVGGNTSGVKFSDRGSVLPVEIWNPETKAWREGADSTVPRNYHSIALLMTDGRVLSAGGGLCNCVADHQNGQVYSPGYLFNTDGSLADRPVINSAPSEINNGENFVVNANAGIKKFSLIKMSSTTHAVNTDLRYLSLNFVESNGRYTIAAHPNRNIMTPGYWMLFAVDDKGVPSIAKVIRVAGDNDLSIEQPEAQTHLLGANVSFPLVLHSGGSGYFSANNLPQGLSINQVTGLISGVPTKVGLYTSKVSYTQEQQAFEVIMTWNIYTRGSIQGVSYEKYEGVWQALPDFSNLTASDADEGVTDSFEIPSASNHQYAISMSARVAIDTADDYTFYLASVDGSRLFVDGELLIDNDGIHALTELSEDVYLEKGEHLLRVEYFSASDNPALNLSYASSSFEKRSIESSNLVQNPLKNIAPVIEVIESQENVIGMPVSLHVIANDANGDPVTFSSNGIPNGLSINSSTGVISGIPSRLGSFDVEVIAQDSQGLRRSQRVSWEITGSLEVRHIRKKPQEVNSLVFYPTGSNATSEVEYKWDFGDGSPETEYSTADTGTHRFTEPGSYTVTLTAKDSHGEESSFQFVQAIYLSPVDGKGGRTSSALVYKEALGAGNIWNVNPDNNTVSGFIVSSLSKIAEIEVGNKPKSLAFSPDGTLWVVNKESATISMVDVASKKVVDTLSLPYGSQPYGIVFSHTEKMAYVVLEASGQLLKINASNKSIVATLTLAPTVRHIAISTDESQLYISRYVSPTTRIESPSIPASKENGGEIFVVRTDTFALKNKIILGLNNGIDSEKNARGLPNYLGGMALSPDGQTAWVPSKQDNIQRGEMRDGLALTFDSAVRSISSKVNLVTNKEDLSARMDHDNGGIASAAIFGRYGSYLFVALEGSRAIDVIDAYNNESLFRLKTERAPQSLAISDDGLTLFSYNFTDRSVTVYDVFNLIYSQSNDVRLIGTLNTVSQEKLSASVLRGKQFFYDSFDERLAKEQYLSCAGCHNEGGTDGRVWDMTNLGEGFRNTISLIGHGGTDQGALHWSGSFDEVQDFEGQIRSLSGGTGLMSDRDFHASANPLGVAKVGVSQDLDDLAAYVSSLKTVPVSPYRNNDGTLTSAANLGRSLFTDKGCSDCHSGEQFTDSNQKVRHDIGTLKASSGSRAYEVLDGLDTPTLLGVWQTAPYLHDGSAETIGEAIKAHNTVTLSNEEVQNLEAYLMQLDANRDKAIVTIPTPVEPTPRENNASSKSGGSVSLGYLYGFFILMLLATFRRHTGRFKAR